MGKPLLVTVSAIAAMTAGCLPSRDNPRDPANAPVAVLKIVDPSGEVSGEVSRGRDLVLDASDSSDPQGASHFWCEFELLEPEALQRALGTSNAPCLFPLGDLRYTLAPETDLLFGVAVRDSQGGLARADTRIRLTNARPVAIAGPPRTLPLGGYPWTPGEPFTVEFTPDGTDADSDTLTYCWTLPGESGEICSVDPHDPRFTRTFVSTTAGRYVATLTVRDEDGQVPGALSETSYPSTTRVVVGPRTLWSAATLQGPIERIDSTRESLTLGGDPEELVFATIVGPRVVYAWDTVVSPASRSNQLVSVPATDLAAAGVTAAPGSGDIALAGDSTRDRLWMYVEDENLPGCGGGAAIALLDPGTLDLATSAPESCWPVSPVNDPLLSIDEAGRIFAAEHLGSRIAFVDPAGSVDDDLLGSNSDLVLGISPRPDTAETWVLIAPDYLGGGQRDVYDSVYIQVLRDDASGMPAPVADGVIKLGVDVAFALGWVSRDEVWISVPERGLVRLDAAVLDAFAGTVDDAYAGALEAATIEVISGVPDVTVLVPDPVTRTVWAEAHTTGGIYRASPGGDLTLFEVDNPPARPQLVDDSGRLLFTTENELHRGNSAARDGVVTTLSLFSSGGIDADLTTGGIWTPVLLPPAVAHVAEDGSLLSFATAMRYGSSNPSTPRLPLAFRLTPGTSTAWWLSAQLPDFSPGPLLRIELDAVEPSGQNVPRATVVFADPAQTAELAQYGLVMEPSAPIPGEAPFVWMIADGVPGDPGTAGVPRVLAVTTNGTLVSGFTPFPIPTPERTGEMRAARSLATNELCLVSVDTVAEQLRVRRIATTGAATLLNDVTTVAFPAGSTLAAVAALPDPDSGGPTGDVCLAAFNTDAGLPRIAAFQQAGLGSPFSWTGTAGETITSLAPNEIDDIWITLQLPDPGGVVKAHVVDGGAPDRVLAPSGPNVFVMPESRPAPFKAPNQ